MSLGTIYCYTSRTSGKSYVGQTWNLGRRYGLSGQRACRLFSRAIKKHGWNDFDLVILDEGIVSQEELDDDEIFWIDYLQTLVPNGYNLTEGGRGGRHSWETRQRMSEAHNGHKVSKETRRKIGEAHKGLKHSKEAKRKMSETCMGRKLLEETKQKISEAVKGFKHSKEAKRKMSEASRGRKHSAASRQKIGEASKGRPCSEETRRKMSEAKRGRKFSVATCRKMSEAKKGKPHRCSMCGVHGHKKPTCTQRTIDTDLSCFKTKVL